MGSNKNGKRKRDAREQPRYHQPWKRELCDEFSRKARDKHVARFTYVAWGVDFKDKYIAYQDVHWLQSGTIVNSVLSQGTSMMLLCKHEELDREGFDQLPAEEKWRCIASRGVYYHALRDVHEAIEGGGTAHWVYPGGSVECVAEGEEEPDPDGHVYARASGEFVLIDAEDAAAWSEMYRREFGVNVSCRVWWQSWRELQDGAALTYEREVPIEEIVVQAAAEVPATPVSVSEAVASEGASAISRLEDVVAQQQRMMAEQSRMMAEMAAQMRELRGQSGASAPDVVS